MRHQGDTEGSAADDEPTTLMPTVNETMRATAEVSDTKAMPRAMKSKDDEPSSPMPTVTETMHATGEVRGTKVVQRRRGPQTINHALSSRR